MYCDHLPNMLSDLPQFELACKDIICAMCYNLYSFDQTVICPKCQEISSYAEIRTFNNSQKNPNAELNSQVEILSNNLHSDIRILESMSKQAAEGFRDISIHIDSLILEITKMISQIKLNLEELFKSIELKQIEIKKSNESYLHAFCNNVNHLINKRKMIIEKLNNSKPRNEEIRDITLNIEALEKIENIELQPYSVILSNDFQSLAVQISQKIVEKIKIEDTVIKIRAEIKTTNPSILISENYDKMCSTTRSKVNEEDFERATRMQNLACSPSSFKLNEGNIEKVNIQESFKRMHIREKSENIFYKKKTKKNPNNCDCEWFIHLNEDLRQLPNFVCLQINRLKDKSKKIWIKKGEETVNLVDLERNLYHSLDPFGNIISERTHELVYIPLKKR